jgi:hypothetical protein
VWKLIFRYLFGHKDKRFIINRYERYIGPDLSNDTLEFRASPTRVNDRGRTTYRLDSESITITSTARDFGSIPIDGKENIVFLRDALIEIVRIMEKGTRPQQKSIRHETNIMQNRPKGGFILYL